MLSKRHRWRNDIHRRISASLTMMERDWVNVIPGGVSLRTAAPFIKAGASALGVGSDLVDVKALREGQGSLITERAR